MKWLIGLLLLTTNAFAADNIFGIDGNNLLLDNSSRKWEATVIYTTDGSGNVIPIGSNSITIGTVTQGAKSLSAAPWQFDLEQIRGATPSATNYVPSRITNGTSYVDPTQIRALTAGTDTVTVQGGNSTAVKVDGSSFTQPISGTISAHMQDNAGNGLTSTVIGPHQAIDVNAVGIATATVGDLSSAGSLTTTCSTPTAACPAGSFLALSINGVASAQLQVSGTFSGATLNVDGTEDGTSWATLLTATGPVGNYSTASFSALGKYRIFRIAGLTQLRVRASALVSGSVSVNLNASIGSNLSEVVQLSPSNLLSTSYLNDGSGNPISSTAGSLNANITNTVPVSQSGTFNVTANAGSGTFTVGQATGTNLHSVIDSGAVTANIGTTNGLALDSTVSSINGKLGTLGQKAMTGSAPVVIASDQSALPVSQSGSWTTGRTWSLLNSTDSVGAVESGVWNITNISGTVSLPTGAATSSNQTSGSQKSQQVDGSGNVQPAGDVVSRPVFVKTSDGTNSITVKAASTASIATDTSMVVGLSPNSPLPTGTNSIGTVKSQLEDNSGTGITLGQKVMASSLPVAIASDQGTLITSLGNTVGKSAIMSPGALTSSATTADQVVITYTVTAGKVFYLQDWDIYVQRSTFNTTAADFGTCSLESPAGAKLWTQELSGAGLASWDKHVGEPFPIPASTVIRIVCTPAASTSTLWRGNLIGYEK